jgi:hypothetical protein
MKFKRRHGEYEQGCVLSESYTATDALPPILPGCRQQLLPACVFVTRDTVRHPRHLFFRKMCSWTDLLVMRGVSERRFHCICNSILLSYFDSLETAHKNTRVKKNPSVPNITGRLNKRAGMSGCGHSSGKCNGWQVSRNQLLDTKVGLSTLKVTRGIKNVPHLQC